MGNEGSQVDIEVESVEVTSSWTLKKAVNSSASQTLSVFVSQAETASQLELAAKKLKVYRHPGIVKYVDTWKHGSEFLLATERITPLAQVLPSVSPLQACLGLRSVLRAIIFLHQTAKVSHNNVCCSSVYVATDGTWKLGNFEFLCEFSDLTPEFLQETKIRRYGPAISVDEGKKTKTPEFVDTFAFAQLVTEVLNIKQVPGELVATATDFLSLTGQLGDLATLLDHAYFSHPVVGILEFLSALTLKSADDKEQFFRCLWVQLATLPEAMVATQLVDLLLSRLVLLEPSAQQNLLPWLLAVRHDNADSGSIQSGECLPLFSKAVFEKHVAPRLVRIFQVRDSQVRSVLLRHFPAYCHAFTTHQLQYDILPELLVGIKDNDDELVAATLRALADLVPLLGAATVVGGKRGKLFTDGRPKVRLPRVSKPEKVAITVTSAAVTAAASVNSSEHIPQDENNSDGEVDAQGLLPERLSPDGGEAWSDWDDQSDEPAVTEATSPVPESANQESPRVKPAMLVAKTSTNAVPIVKTINNDLDCLDVKMAKITAPPLTQEVDFFQDMEPVISSSSSLLLGSAELDTNHLDSIPLDPNPNTPPTTQLSKFSVEEKDVEGGEGWGAEEGEAGWEDEDLDWGSNDEEIKLAPELTT